MASSLRNKQGTLDLYKGKSSWKSYVFKVTGSTYFHYFNEKKLTVPKDQMFLKSIKSIDIPSKTPKNGQYVFEVNYTGKGSPWILSARTEEERLEWMETILPNSTRLLKTATTGKQPVNNGVTMETHGPHPPQQQQAPYPTKNDFTASLQMPQPHPPDYSSQLQRSVAVQQPHPPTNNQPHLPPVSQMMPQSYSPTNNQPHSPPGSQVMPEPHPPMNTQPIETTQLHPEATFWPHPPIRHAVSQPHPPTTLPLSTTQQQPSVTQSLNAVQLSNNKKASDELPLRRVATQRGSMNDRPPMPQPRPLALVINNSPAEYLEPTQLNMPPNSTSTSNGSLHTAPIQNGHHETDAQQPPLSPLEEGDTSYLILQRPRSRVIEKEEVCLIRGKDTCTYLPLTEETKVTTPLTPPTPSAPPPSLNAADSEMLGLLQRQFTPMQINKLMDMLLKMQMQDSPENVKSLDYLMTKTAGTLSDSILYTEEDDTNFYDKRPFWAKAIYEEQSNVSSSTSLLPEENEADRIPRSSLLNMKKIGAGQFGEVYSADYSPDNTPQNAIKVAIKTAKKDCTEQQRKDILREISVMANMVHPNIVRLYGIVQEDEASLPWLVLEYLPNGDLKHYLTNSPKKSMDTLVKYMVDVAMGMHYIAERGLIHRDLAARNVLVGEGELCKVADFGLLRELPEDDSIYVSSSNIPCPIRWMPPEAVCKRSFSVASDVWSFGILQWEMLNPGKLPYQNISNYELLGKISNGYRMPTPRRCPPTVARIMKACWHADPNKRPSFLVITSLLTTKVSSVAPPKTLPGATPTSNNLYL